MDRLQSHRYFELTREQISKAQGRFADERGVALDDDSLEASLRKPKTH